MTVHGNFLGSVRLSGDEAKALTRNLSHGRVNVIAVTSAQKGHKLATSFAKWDSVVFKFKPACEFVK
jgi:hypothetical protein